MSSSQQTPANSGRGRSNGSTSHTQDGADAPQAHGEAHQAQNGAAQAQEEAPLGQADQIQGRIDQVQGQVQGQAHAGHQAHGTDPDRARGSVVMPTLGGGFAIRSSNAEDARRLIERLLSPPNNGPENSGPR
ncbi:hypothetical protein NW755_012617 [Fusarium falciforme]|uniref:Uncharacterized protein n=1 Tax=Fusarium falciforme TaxID=195108 RepID=A0A9W8UUN3_9HYPO|nr:hypothetical protein NW755_012617 [Fusarium falciforme]